MADFRVTITKDKVNSVISAINKLVAKEVLIGIPEEKTDRDDPEQHGPMTNASLGYIHEFGSPAANIPERPFLIPGVRKSIPQVIPYLKGAVAAALDGKPSIADKQLEAAGLRAEASVKREISSGNFAPLSPLTIARRYRSRDTQSRRQSEDHYLRLVAGGMSPAEAQAAAGIRPLLNTLQLLKSITSVVRKK